MSTTKVLEIPEGKLFWRYDSPVLAKGVDQSQIHNTIGTRPMLFFIHAGVSDHTLWDEQVVYCTAKGWGCLRYDVFGYGLSKASEDFIAKGLRPPVRHYDHVRTVMEAYLESALSSGGEGKTTFVVVGLSRGGGIAVEFVLSYPDMVSGLVICAGGLGGLDIPNPPEEERLFNLLQQYADNHDIEHATRTLVSIWGDGPLQKPGRSSNEVREKLYEWCKATVTSEISGTGGFAIPFEELENPPAASRLPDVKTKTIVATGIFDESSTNRTMEYAAQHVPGAKTKVFEAAHMINLECPEMFNDCLGSFLEEIS